MRNLLTEPMSVADILAILTSSSPRLLMPPQGAARWREVRERPALQGWVGHLREQAAAERGRPLPELTDELYAGFHRDGSRLPFERPYFERRQRLARATLCALLFPDESPWPSEVERITRGVMEEVSWALPAHVDDVSGKDPGRIDLFSAETAEMLGAVTGLLRDALPDDLRAAVGARLRSQITDNFLTVYSHPKNPGVHWTHAPMNWNAVCHQGVVGAALWREEDPEVLARVLRQAADGLVSFLDSFGADGGSSEGPGYWGYGFGRFAWLNEQIETSTDGRLSLFAGDTRISEIAAFARRMSVEGGQFINFADCAPRGVPDPALSAYLGERLNDPANRRQAQASYAFTLAQGGSPGGGRLFDLLRFALYCPPEMDSTARPPAEDWYFGDLQVLVAHGQDTMGRRAVFAAKGGHNAEHHNHNDCSSFVFYLDGVCFASEIGAPEYVKAFFGPDRYTEFLAARSLGHSVPLINGVEQEPGRVRAARVMSHVLSRERAELTLDLTACYPSAAACAQARRRLTFDPANLRLEIEDEFTLTESRPLETAFITEADVTLETDGGALLSREGRQVHLRPGPTTVVSDVQTHSYSDHSGLPRTVTRIVFTPHTLAESVTLRYAILPDGGMITGTLTDNL